MADNSPGLWASIGAAIPSLGTLGLAAYKFLQDRKERSHDAIVIGDRDSAQGDLNEAAKQIIDQLNVEIARLKDERDKERQSGVDHYGRCVRMYGLLGRIVAGEKAPDKLPRMEDL